jgi:hypothetical protein
MRNHLCIAMSALDNDKEVRSIIAPTVPLAVSPFLVPKSRIVNTLQPQHCRLPGLLLLLLLLLTTTTTTITKSATPIMVEEDGEEHQLKCKVRAKTNASRRTTKVVNNKKDATTLMQDRKMRSLLTNADDIQSVEHFAYWKEDLYVVVVVD